MEMLELRLHLLYPGSFFPEEKVLVVDSVEHGIKKAKEWFKNSRFYGFYFTEHEYVTYMGKRYWKDYNDSKKVVTYLIAKQVMTHDDVVKLGNPTLLFNMEANHYPYIIQTVMGNYQPYFDDGRTIVFDRNFRLINMKSLKK